jgi:glycosyltransferase involved in cell wall biosynthesis
MSKKIVVIPSFYPMELHYQRGGFFEEQALLIRESGTDVSVIFNENRELTSFNLTKLRRAHFQQKLNIERGMPVFRGMDWNLIPMRFDLGKTFWIKRCIRLIESYIKQFGKPDLFHVQCLNYAGYVAEYFKNKLNIPFVITEHLSVFATTKLSDKRRLEALRIYRAADKVIVVSKPFRSILAQGVGLEVNEIEVVPNFIDTDYFDPIIDLKGSAGTENVVFTVCHHEKNKCLDRLIESFEQVLLKHPGWTLYIGGNGKETFNLKKKVDELQLTGKIIFTGFLSKEQVRFYLKKAKIFVLSSNVETFGVVLIEAMSMGVPVVSTLSGGPEDIINDFNGLLVEKNPLALANGINQVIEKIGTYDRKQIRAHILANFSGSSVVSVYNNIYNYNTTN